MATTQTRKVSPKAVFRFPNLIKPDMGTAKHPKPDGEYNVQLVFNAQELEAFKKTIQNEIDEARTFAEASFAKLNPASRKKLGSMSFNEIGTELYDKETEEPTGEFSVKFATKASGKNKKTGEKWNRSLPMFDAKGKTMKGVTSVWGGSVGKVAFTCAPYFVEGTGTGGLKLFLESVQIIDLRQGGGGSASDYGFGEEEGYTQEASEFEDESSGDTDDSGDDF